MSEDASTDNQRAGDGDKPRDKPKPKPKRKPMRRDHEKRRQQNIEAQRRYRQRVRERLESLEALAATAQQASPSLTDGVSTNKSDSASEMPGIGTSIFNDCETGLATSNMVAPQMIMNDVLPWDPSMWDMTGSLPYLNTSGSPLSFMERGSEIFQSEPELMVSRMIEDTESCRHSQLTTATVDCACDRPHLQIKTYKPDPETSVEVTILDLGGMMAGRATVPDLYANHIRLDSVCTMAAMDVLRLQIGLTEDMMCAKDIPSPFYRKIRATAQGTSRTNIIDAVQKTFRALQPDLRPCPEQITVPHAPYVDALPFQILRKNLIAQQDDFDSAEFLCDSVTGLVCWGGAGLSRRDRDAATGSASTGTPWDSRSWEAKGWFLRKYWSLLGGQEGELVRQSEWWCGMRGEELALGSPEITASA